MMTTQQILHTAAEARSSMLTLDTAKKNEAIIHMASALRNAAEDILKANSEDMAAAAGTISDVMLDRLRLTPQRIEEMAKGILAVAALPDPVGRVLSETVPKNGLLIKKVSVPLGVVAIIYESRPNVTSDAAVLAFKSGNVSVLRSGKEAFRSAKAIVTALRQGLMASHLPGNYINLIEDTTRASANELMNAVGFVDLLIPRGGKGLITACVENARVPCIETGTGICHIYVDASADIDMALNIIDNAKTSRPSVCNAAEVLLVHSAVAEKLLPALSKRFEEDRMEKGLCPVELRVSKRAAALIDGTPAGAQDFDTEFLDYCMAVDIVDSVEEAIRHINKHSTGHSESIVTKNRENAALFTKMIDSAAVYVNASTRFTDGGEFGLGCEMGISTGKLHARGPMGLCELNTYKYIIKGNGQIR